jgi:hypothetical protein
MECVWRDDGTCTRCGLAGYAIPGGGIASRNCRPGLGDLVAAGLSSIGITKERAQAVAQAVGLEDCGCAERQMELNELGRRLGFGSSPPSP